MWNTFESLITAVYVLFILCLIAAISFIHLHGGDLSMLVHKADHAQGLCALLKK